MTTQRTRQVVEDDDHDPDGGLALDLPRLMTRRRALGLAALGGLEETAGPYPADGSNGIDVLSESGVVRSDITGSFGTGRRSRGACRSRSR